MDGADSSDPELGGATFTNFNVDAVQEIQSSSGWMPAEIGRGGAGYTNIVTRSGTNGLHGSVFEFLRNSALDARNYFDHSSPVSPGRIPPFRRNEFGFTNGGPVFLPHIYDGRRKDLLLRRIPRIPPGAGNHAGLPCSHSGGTRGAGHDSLSGRHAHRSRGAGIAKVLARYPLPNYTQGAYGIHTYATSSNVVTNADQFSVRMDHQWGPNHFFGRVSFDNLTGPTTNPDQTVLDPSFGVAYIDHQRNLAFDFSRAATKRLTLETMFSITRTTPSFVTTNQTDPAVKFNDSLFETFNVAGGSVIAAFNNLFALRQSFAYTTARHAFRFGARGSAEPGHHVLRYQPKWRIRFRRRYRLLKSRDGIAERRARHPRRRSVARYTFQLSERKPLRLYPGDGSAIFSNGEHIGPAAINRNQGAAGFRTRGRSPTVSR